MDDDIKFRDQCAIEVLIHFLNADKEFADKNSRYSLMYLLKSDKQDKNTTGYERVEELSHFAFRIADIMRKARLVSFE